MADVDEIMTKLAQATSDISMGQVSPLDMEEDEFYTWFAGLSSGEATFYSRLKPLPSGNTTVYNEFKIALRIDDKPMLDGIHERLGIGMVHRVKAYGNAKAQAAFRVIQKDELYYSIVPIFDKYPLKSKKQLDFEIWREIVKLATEGDPVANIEEIATLVQDLKEGRSQGIDMKSQIAEGQEPEAQAETPEPPVKD